MTRQHHLTDRQRQAIDEAGAVFASLTEHAAQPAPELPTEIGSVGATARSRDGLAAAVTLFTDTMLRIIDGFAELAEQAAGDAPPDPDGHLITLRTAAGRTVTATVWMHNLTAGPVTGGRLRLTRLTAPDGTEVDGSAAVFEPAELVVAAEQSAHSVLALSVPHTVPTGVYHGHVLGIGLPDAAVAVRLIVEP